ncbi:hypothetical protein SDC9_182620 [bioreactor metagenome]|uniref:Uncharacterized protein n=1 Tax=bioreactor metagenome TaxID=1076179 RepID=A0A645H816_9ZZZZ
MKPVQRSDQVNRAAKLKRYRRQQGYHMDRQHNGEGPWVLGVKNHHAEAKKREG